VLCIDQHVMVLLEHMHFYEYACMMINVLIHKLTSRDILNLLC